MLSSEFVMTRVDRWVTRFSNNTELMSSFRLCDSDAERFRLVWEFLRKVEPRLSLVADEHTQKSAAEAERVRKIAQGQFQGGNHELALYVINESLVRSPWPSSKRDFSSQLLLGLEERAAMFFKMKRFDECVQDINLIAALDLAAKPHLKHLLAQKVKALRGSKRFREAVDCITKDFVALNLFPEDFWTKDNEGDEIWQSLKKLWSTSLRDLSEIPKGKAKQAPLMGLVAKREKLKKLKPKNGYHSIFKSASSLVRLNYTPAAGRHLVATGDFNTGDVVLVEPSYVTCVQRCNWVSHCTGCTMATDSPIPCPTCALVSFCSIACSSSLRGQLHEKECKILPILSTCEPEGKNLDTVVLFRILVLRTLLMKTPDEWRAFSTRYPGNAAGEASDEFQGIPKPDAYEWNDYDNVFCLLKNAKKKDHVDMLKETFNACFVIRAMEQHREFSAGPLDKQLRVFLGGLALRHLLNFPTNAEETSDYLLRANASNNTPRFMTAAYAVYPTYALCNYSCFPNLYSTFYGDSVVVRARRPIKKGDVLAARPASYEFLLSPKPIRQEYIKQHHHFICKCLGCVNNWPSRSQICYGPKALRPPHRLKCLQCSGVFGTVESLLSTTTKASECPKCGVVVDADQIRRRINELMAADASALKGRALFAKADEAWALFEFPCSTIVEFEKQAMLEFSSEGNTVHLPENLPIGGTVAALGGRGYVEPGGDCNIM